MVLVALIYSTGMSGGWIFDDYPNIVDNPGVQPSEASIPALVRAAMSSPASEFKRPLASLSFATNYLVSGLEPYAWKLTNLLIHLLNGLLVFLLAKALLQESNRPFDEPNPSAHSRLSESCVAALIAGSWMLLPINLTAVLYVVQRMESMANLFVLVGLIGYVAGRRRMLAAVPDAARDNHREWSGLLLCLVSIILPTLLGLLAKETAVMLPLYALLVEWAIFRWRKAGSCTVDEGVPSRESLATASQPDAGRALPAVSCRDPSGEASAGSARSARAAPGKDWRVIMLFLVALVLPMLVGMIWLLPELLKPEAWTTRNFTLSTRLLSEARIIADYIGWTLFPTPNALSFYHDDFGISKGLLSPWITLASIVFLTALTASLPWLRRRQP
ncbi:MAG: hypothetical protein ABIQ36_05135, partial [Rhodanobacter sp.]